MKKCLGCGKVKSLSMFTRDRQGGKKGLKSRCKACRVKETATWRKQNGGKRFVDPLSYRMQIMTSHLCHSGSTLRSKDLYAVYNTQQGKCAYTGIVMKVISTTRQDPLIMSLDRIDPSKGYTKDNICMCCLGMNWLKGTGTIITMYSTLKQLWEGANVLKNSGRIPK